MQCSALWNNEIGLTIIVIHMVILGIIAWHKAESYLIVLFSTSSRFCSFVKRPARFFKAKCCLLV